ncbi:MAG TPA: sialidase family protein [Terriglobales bacterium]|nr:sialidase family protein [Terriglobales bacterium]
MKAVYRVIGIAAVLALATAIAAGQTSSPALDSGAPGSLSCSPAPCVLPPTQASEGGAEVTDTPIAADPINPQHLLLGSVDFNCPQPGISGFHISSDGGSTWSRTCMPAITTQELVYWPGGEPMVGYDLNGTAYIADGYGDSEGLGYGLIAFQKSTDGANWSAPEIALGSPSRYELPLYGSLAVDTNLSSPYVNSLYVSAVVLNEPDQNKNQVVVSHSSDGGASWKAVKVAPAQTYPASDDFTSMAVGRDGTVYLDWQYCSGSGPSAGCGNGTAYVLFSKSVDGGNTWSFPTLMTVVTVDNSPCHCGSGLLPNTDDIRVYNYPAIGVDNSDGPFAGTLYVAAYSWTGTYMRVGVIHSTDGGNTWSKPVPVASAQYTHDQFFPWLSVSSTGLVGVSWLDRRNDPANIDYQAFAAISTDGGQSFQPNVQLTQKFSNPNNNGSADSRWMGDYAGNTWDGPDFVAAWMDSSNGVDMQEVVGGIRLK